jgi:hypothetical protein
MNFFKLFSLVAASLSITFLGCDNKDETAEVAKITINTIELDLVIGEKETLVATVEPSDAVDKTVTWSSSNPGVATVGEISGEVTALTAGRSTITATSTNGKTTTCRVMVTAAGVRLNKTGITLLVGEKETLIATVIPEDAPDNTVSWSSGKPSIASVNASTGEVTALAGGVTTITATASVGGKTASCEVTVLDYESTKWDGSSVRCPLDLNQTAKTATIKSAADMAWLASACNGNENVSDPTFAGYTFTLDSDLDLGGHRWTPIGNGTFTFASNAVTISGNRFKGTFDGGGHTISGLSITSDNNTDGGTAGFFGVLQGATVKNIVFGEAGSLDVSSGAITDCGVVAGLSYDSTVEYCTNYLPMNYSGTSPGRVTIGMIGFMFTANEGAQIKNCTNYGKMTAGSTNNATSGATAIHCAGICGFASTAAAIPNVILDCNNRGDMVSATGRTSGIVAAANRYTNISYCTNYGNQTNSAISGTGRLGNIVCYAGSGCYISNAVNRGNLVSTTGGRCGGIVCLSGTNTFENCENYGEVLTDSPSRGLLWSYTSYEVSWMNCTADGKVGTYGAGTAVYDNYSESNKVKYLGTDTTPYARLYNIVYAVIGETGGGNPDVEPTLRILFIGNSFTADAVEHLPGIVAAAGVNSLKMGFTYYGGRTITEHNANYATPEYVYWKCTPGMTSWTKISGYSIKDAVLEEPWDIVSIQEHTGRADAWNWTTTEKAAIEGLINKVKADRTSAPQIVYIMSQAYGNPDVMGSYSASGPLTNNFTSQAAMFEAITTQGRKVLDETQVEEIIATGTVLQNLRSSSLNTPYDLTRDGYHMDYGLSRYAASCAVFESIISPHFGNIKLDNNSFRYDISNTTAGSYTTPVTDANAPTALQAARSAITQPFTVTPMN